MVGVRFTCISPAPRLRKPFPESRSVIFWTDFSSSRNQGEQCQEGRRGWITLLLTWSARSVARCRGTMSRPTAFLNKSGTFATTETPISNLDRSARFVFTDSTRNWPAAGRLQPAARLRPQRRAAELLQGPFCHPSNELKSSLQEQVDAFSPDVLILDAYVLAPKYRGFGLGRLVLRRCIDLLACGCGLGPCLPCPMQQSGECRLPRSSSPLGSTEKGTGRTRASDTDDILRADENGWIAT